MPVTAWLGVWMIRQFDYTEFLPVEEITARKRQSGVKISLVIPALNESATISTVVSEAKRALVDETGFLDEIIVIDDGRSTDGTSELAEKAGARVYCADSIMSERGFPQGKGTSLWKSQFVTTGDIIVCVDADIVNFDPRFVYGVAGPLVCFPELSFVKAFYDRPLEFDGAVLQHQGGRVTELLVRPFLSMFYPQLAGMYQPLAGEYAFRRSVAERVGFFSGYGVEIGLILDITGLCGMEHIAQVDMRLRRHRNRSIQELGIMSFGVLQAMITRLVGHGIMSLAEPAAEIMISPDGAAGFRRSAPCQAELPPAIAIKGGV
jgi:glucosyl-3-phosphoglycerate synthase